MIRAQQLRIDARLSVAQLAKEIKVSRATIARLEQSGEPGHFDVLVKIAERFKVEPSELLLPVGVVEPGQGRRAA